MTVTLCGKTREDLIAIPAVMMGFHPHDSLVVLGVFHRRVAFCARVALSWFAFTQVEVGGQMLRAARQVDVDEFIVIGYGDRDLAARSVAEMVDVLGAGSVSRALILDDDECWELGSEGPPTPFAFEYSALAAQAVYAGLNVARSREEAVARVWLHNPAPRSEQGAVRDEVADLTANGRLALLAQLLDAPDPPDAAQALRIATLLQDEDCLAAVIAALNSDTAPRLWDRLSAAREVAPDEAEEAVLAVLALASWLAGKAAALTCCVEQLEARNADHPVAELARTVYHLPVPPGGKCQVA